MDMVHTIYPSNVRIKFDEREAAELLDIFLRITRKSKNEVTKLKSRLLYFQGKRDKIIEIQDLINNEVQKWSEKVTRLGGIPISLWKVKVPGKDGKDFIWEFPRDRYLTSNP